MTFFFPAVIKSSFCSKNEKDGLKKGSWLEVEMISDQGSVRLTSQNQDRCTGRQSPLDRMRQVRRDPEGGPEEELLTVREAEDTVPGEGQAQLSAPWRGLRGSS